MYRPPRCADSPQGSHAEGPGFGPAPPRCASPRRPVAGTRTPAGSPPGASPPAPHGSGGPTGASCSPPTTRHRGGEHQGPAGRELALGTRETFHPVQNQAVRQVSLEDPFHSGHGLLPIGPGPGAGRGRLDSGDFDHGDRLGFRDHGVPVGEPCPGLDLGRQTQQAENGEDGFQQSHGRVLPRGGRPGTDRRDSRTTNQGCAFLESGRDFRMIGPPAPPWPDP